MGVRTFELLSEESQRNSKDLTQTAATLYDWSLTVCQGMTSDRDDDDQSGFEIGMSNDSDVTDRAVSYRAYTSRLR